VFLQIDEQPQKSFALFNLGFRPFFLFAAYAAVILMLIWLLMYHNVIQLNAYYGFINWHSHEMLFGYSSAVIAGFLLTAVRNWTNVDTITRTPLAILAFIWLAARFLPFTPLPGSLTALASLLFFLLLTLAIMHPIIKVKQQNNFIMIVLAFCFLIADLLVQLQHLGYLQQGVKYGNMLALYTILFVIMVLSGRVMPFFTRVVVPGTEIVERPVLEKSLLILFVLLALADLFSFNGYIISLLAAALTVTHIIRVKPWFSGPVLNVPILWVLYAGYLWIIIGFVLKALAGIGMVTDNLAIHAWTVGGVGIITYGMMARVSLGHTGREMTPPRLVIIGFFILFLAAAIRVFLPMISISLYPRWIDISGFLWIVAFVLFAISYTSILYRPRVDGREG
jgi:uncharacterized protein involved in response to NO